MEKALEIGCDGVEVDIRSTKDGHLVLLHDDTLVRTTNVSEVFPDREHDSVDTFTLAELKMLDAGSWFLDSDPFDQIRTGMISFPEMEKFQGCTIPTLEEFLAPAQRPGLSRQPGNQGTAGSCRRRQDRRRNSAAA